MQAERPAAGVKFLVVDNSAFQRRLIAETLRAFGAQFIDYADSAESGLIALAYSVPDVLITAWDMEGASGLTLVRRLRSGDCGPALKRLPIVMIAERNKTSDIQRARNHGVDEFLLRPFSTSALLARIEAVTKNRREFIESVVYVGPCRRRKMVEDYDGPLRRLFDASEPNADTPDTQIKKGLARMYAERITTLLAEATPENLHGMRDLSLACAQLHALALDLNEKLLLTATQSLLHYIRGVGAAGDLQQDVIGAHLDAIVQLAELPNSQVEIRQTVTRELGLMVAKKLRQAAAAAVDVLEL